MSNGQSEILSEIDQGSMLNFAIGDDYLAALEYASGLWIGVAGSPATFTVSMYAYQGGMDAKISLGQNDRFWYPVSGGPEGLQNGISLALAEFEPGQFVLTDDGQGEISIKNVSTPPPPFYQVVSGGSTPFPYLASGFDSALLSLFTISIVG